jgi:CHAD domain-containing protein
MAYRFERDFATVQDGVRKIAIELIDDAIDTANHRGRDFHETVHSLRKACKKLRGLIRVVRPVFDDYRTENAVFRDAGRHFSLLRDGGVMIETYDGLLEEYKDQVDRSKFVRIRRRFTVLQKEMEAHEDFATTIDKFRQTMKSSRKRVRRWHVDDDGFDAIEPGVKKSYKGAQRAMIVASNAPLA